MFQFCIQSMSSKSELTMIPYILSHHNLTTDIQHMQKQLFVYVPSVVLTSWSLQHCTHMELHIQELNSEILVKYH